APIASLHSVTITGGDGTDTLTGPDLVTVWTLTGANAGTLNPAGGPTISFTGIEALATQPTGANQFVLPAGAPASRTTVTLNDNDNNLRVTQLADGAISIEPLDLSGFGAATVTNVANATPVLTVAALGGNDAVMVDSLLTTFAPQLTVQAGAGNDVVVVGVAPSLAPKISVDGGAGIDRLDDYTGLAGASVTNVEVGNTGLPTFTEQGPGAISQTPGLDALKFPATAAVQTVVCKPANAPVVLAG